MKIFDLNNEFAVSARIQHLKNKKILFDRKDNEKHANFLIRARINKKELFDVGGLEKEIEKKINEKSLFNTRTLNIEKRHAFNLGLTSTSKYSVEISNTEEEEKGKFLFANSLSDLSNLLKTENVKRAKKKRELFAFPINTIPLKDNKTNQSAYEVSTDYIGKFLRPLSTGESKTISLAPGKSFTFSLQNSLSNTSVIKKKDIFNFK